MADVTPAAKSWKTTAAGVAMILGAVAAAVTQYVQGGMPAVKWEVLVAAITGGVGLIFAKDSGVSNSPNPGPAMKVAKGSVATKVGVVFLLLGLAAPAQASGPLVQCLSGCTPKASAGADMKLKADTAVTDQWWLGPSVGLALAARDNATGVWETNIAFQFQYGMKWRPSWWTATSTFMSFDLGLAAGTSVQSPDFAITLAPTVSFLDLIAIGYGPRFHFNTGTSVSGVLFLGLSTSFGGP